MKKLKSLLVETTLPAIRQTPIDLQSVIKASQSISRFILLDELLTKLMSIIIEQAGADQGCLLLEKDGRFLIQAQAQLDSRQVSMVPESVINLASRSKRTLIIDDPDRSPGFELDPYFHLNHPRSILCIPILKQGNISALLYLENNHTVSAFSRERISIIELLGTQAAISMENALLYQKAQESIRAREDFLMITSHELRTPLTPLKLQVQSLLRLVETRRLEAMPSDALEKVVQNCDRQINRIEVLVEKLLDFSVIRSGAMILDLEECNLRELLDLALKAYSVEIERKKIPITIKANETIIGYWSRARIIQVLNKLIENAIQYGNRSEITIEMYFSDSSRKRVIFKIQDHGMGISSADQSRVFELFERAVPTRNISGLGLGLYIVKEVVTAHGGAIQLESESGKGTTFTIELPIKARGRLVMTHDPVGTRS